MLLPDFLLLDARDLVFNAEDGFFVINMLALLALGHDLGFPTPVVLEDAHTGILRGERHIKAVCRRSEDGVALCFLHR